MFVYCPCCGNHTPVQGSMGDWIRTCVACQEKCLPVFGDDEVTHASLEELRLECPHQDLKV